MLYILAYVVLVSLIHWQLRFSLIFFGIGIFLGNALLGLDSILYCYLKAPHEFTSQRVRRLFTQRQFREGFSLLSETQMERSRMIFHSVLFQVILLIVAFFVLTSTSSLLGKGLVLGILLHSLIDQWAELKKKGQLGSWFWQFKLVPAKQLQRIYFGVLVFLFLVFSLLWV